MRLRLDLSQDRKYVGTNIISRNIGHRRNREKFRERKYLFIKDNMLACNILFVETRRHKPHFW